MIIMDRHGTGVSQSDAKSKQIPKEVFNAKDHGIFAVHVDGYNCTCRRCLPPFLSQGTLYQQDLYMSKETLPTKPRKITFAISVQASANLAGEVRDAGFCTSEVRTE